MGLFGKMFGKEEKEDGCCKMEIAELDDSKEAQGCDYDVSDADAIHITVMGSGCKRCYKLNDNAKKAASLSSKKVEVEYITDSAIIAEAGIISTPAFLINGKVISQGIVLTQSEIEKLL